MTEEDIHKILLDLGSKEPEQDKNGDLKFTTVCHGGTKHKLYYYHESRQFHCYTDCSDNLDIYEVVIRTKKEQGVDVTFPKAVEYVSRVTGKTRGFGYTGLKSNKDLINDWDFISKFSRKAKSDRTLPSYNENVLDVFMSLPHESWLEEGISYETMEKYEIGYYFREKEEGIVIPHRDINGRLIGIRRRSMIQEQVDAGYKYMPLTVGNTMYNHLVTANLYGLNHTAEAVKRLRKLMIFESEKSVLKCQDFYGELNFTTAICSSNISDFHRDIATSLGIEEVFIALDKMGYEEDEEKFEKKEQEYQERILKFAKKFAPYCRVYVLWDDEGLLDWKDSPADRGKEVLEEMMKNKTEITMEGAI
ncbi:hypothetical protein SAMN05421503_1476 [Terribacillus aidingensis]|uniref:DNA primase n=1 Tax=Terribacillus aidingensis TaxID=586416 RepID=A0A285NQX3_9BACI|nr:hypothetical protein [Terribacillus aidingensis]SNZ10021.1 hypothetical protein SAMN05421503_1476 [Terribacillus aidingensis]